MLFNNNDVMEPDNTCTPSCYVCANNSRGDQNRAIGKQNQEEYVIDRRNRCGNSGIYIITCKCKEQYIGKTTVTFRQRFKEHCTKETTVKEHMRSCVENPEPTDLEVQFAENVWGRGKYSLSEREYLWNKRLKGTINVQKLWQIE